MKDKSQSTFSARSTCDPLKILIFHVLFLFKRQPRKKLQRFFIFLLLMNEKRLEKRLKNSCRKI